uniref:Cytochrome P450 704C1-like n=1 Tax=Nelumbo nucifera TaxID=4432 RepID=A0A822ZX21_NELNU|nr:TPA_asm: hypothetical protein HUJ06_018028 [Nelumbo nucifera]
MDFVSDFLTVASVALFLLFSCFCALLAKIFMGKSLMDSRYAPVKGTIFHQFLHFSRIYDYLTQVARTHQTFRFLAPSHSQIYTTDPRNIEYVLKTNFDKYSKGHYNQDILTDLVGHGIFAADGDRWRQQRKLASFEFSTRVLKDFSCAVFRRKAAKLAGIILEFAITNQTLDIQDLLMRCTLDSIFKVGFGMDLDCLGGSSKQGVSFIKAFDESNELVSWRYADPLWKVKRFLNMGSEAKLKKNIKIIDDLIYELIQSKRKQLSVKGDSNEKEDILSRFIVESEKDPMTLNDQYLRDIILNFMFAGKDTTSNTLSWFFYMLCKHPLIQEKIAQEVTEAFNGEPNEANIDEFVISNLTDAAMEKMHYLHAALTETLRLYPAVPVDGRCPVEDDVLPDGFRLRKGDSVLYIAYAMGRMARLWGEDAEDFRPERWLKNGIFQPESPFKFVAFHAGPRMCLGKDFAYRQMKIVAMVLLRFFRFRLADENKAVTYRTMFTFHINGGLQLGAIPRFGLTDSEGI